MGNNEVRYDVMMLDEIYNDWVLSKSFLVMFDAIKEAKLLNSNGYNSKIMKVIERKSLLSM